MNIRAAVILGMALYVLSAHAKLPHRELVLNLSHEDIARIHPGSETTLESFEKDWGQFEVLIPKQRFPVPAPNCRKNVILRMPAVAPDAPDHELEIRRRWIMFQSLHNLARNRIESVQTRLAAGPYMKFDDDRQPVLEYCNAYFGKDFLVP